MRVSSTSTAAQGSDVRRLSRRLAAAQGQVRPLTGTAGQCVGHLDGRVCPAFLLHVRLGLVRPTPLQQSRSSSSCPPPLVQTAPQSARCPLCTSTDTPRGTRSHRSDRFGPRVSQKLGAGCLALGYGTTCLMVHGMLPGDLSPLAATVLLSLSMTSCNLGSSLVGIGKALSLTSGKEQLRAALRSEYQNVKFTLG